MNRVRYNHYLFIQSIVDCIFFCLFFASYQRERQAVDLGCINNGSEATCSVNISDFRRCIPNSYKNYTATDIEGRQKRIEQGEKEPREREWRCVEELVERCGDDEKMWGRYACGQAMDDRCVLLCRDCMGTVLVTINRYIACILEPHNIYYIYVVKVKSLIRIYELIPDSRQTDGA